MKTEDFERLKQICEKEGFWIMRNHNSGSAIVDVKKDPWEGVEFAEYLFPWPDQRDHFKVKQITEKMVIATDGTEMFKDNCKPSTQDAYEEQLKRIAKEKFGDIKEGDRFDCSPLGYNPNASIILSDIPNWEYNKKIDEFCLDGFPFYKQGKWAERVKETYKFTEEDLKKAIAAAWMMGQKESNNLTDCMDLIIESLKKELHIEVKNRHFRTVKNQYGQIVDCEYLMELKIKNNQIKAVWK